MKAAIINKSDIAGFLDSLMGEYRVLAPVKEHGYAVFREIHSGGEAFLEYGNSKKPPKEIFFPQSEVMFAYNLDGDELGIKGPANEEKPRIVFGIRPCDARSLALLDKVFRGELYQDVYYSDRRDKTLVVALGCNAPGSTCFCTSVGGSPFSMEGADLLMVDIGEKYVVRSVTDKGEQFLERHLKDSPADEQSLGLMQKSMEKAEASMKPGVAALEIKDKLDRMFDDPFWDSLHEKCLGCAVCTYLCPTCHCFDISDEAVDRSGQRVRTWDTCAFPAFTQEALGVNPRPTNKERMRQRVMHKFRYFVDNHGMPGCVGCGRCVRECPVNLDIRKVIDDISCRKD